MTNPTPLLVAQRSNLSQATPQPGAHAQPDNLVGRAEIASVTAFPRNDNKAQFLRSEA